MKWGSIRGRMLAGCLLAGSTLAPSQVVQSSKGTVRHHRVEVENDAFPPELRKAEDALDKKDYAAAEALLNTLTAKDAKNYRAWFDLGFVYTAQGRTEDSISAYRKAVASKPDVFESNLNLGLILARTGNPDAEMFLHAATQLKPTDKTNEGLERAWVSFAHVVEGSKPEAAAGAYREAVRLQPDVAETHLGLGAVLERQKDAHGAEAEYQKALTLASGPNVAPDGAAIAGQAVTALANLYMQEKRFPEAEAMLRKLADAHANDAVVHIQLGRVLAASAKYEDAATELQTGLKLTPNDASAVRDLADIFSLQKKNADAEPLYRQLLAAAPRDAELHASLGKSLLDQHKFPEAQAEFVTATQLKPDFGSAFGDLAAAAEQNKDYPLVIAALDARAKFLPELPFGYFLRATAFDHLRDRKNAALNYHKFLDTSDGKFPDQEWQARHRLIAIEPKK